MFKVLTSNNLRAEWGLMTKKHREVYAEGGKLILVIAINILGAKLLYHWIIAVSIYLNIYIFQLPLELTDENFSLSVTY